MTNERAYVAGSELPALRPGVLRLYNMRFCPYAHRTRLVLEHKGIRYETVNVHLARKPEWFVERNPLGLVPVLEKDGKVIYESVVCNEFLEDTYQQKRLVPEDPYLKARDRMLIESFEKIAARLKKIGLTQGQDSRDIKRLHKDLMRYEIELKHRGAFFGGDSPCMVDYTMWPWFERLPIFLAMFPDVMLSFPNLVKWTERMLHNPHVQATSMPLSDHISFAISLKNRKPDYDYGLKPIALSKY